MAGFTFYNLVLVFFIFIIIFLIAKIIIINLRRSLKDNLKASQLRIILKLVNFAGVIIALVIALPILGVSPTGILVAGGIVGLVLAFATQSVITNFISGLFLFMERPIKIGDGVNLDGKGGTVEDVRIFSTIIRGYDGYTYRIPNEKVFTDTITNYSTTSVRRFEYALGIRYSDDATKAIALIDELIEDHTYILKNPASQSFVDNLSDNSVNIIVKLWAPASVWYSVKIEFLKEIKTTLESNGIEIAFPQRTLWLGNEPVAKSINEKIIK